MTEPTTGIPALWRRMDSVRRAALVGSVLATLAGVAAIATLATERPMALLYAGLDPAAAGEVVGGLEAMGIPYELRGDAVLVEEAARDRARLALARDGLPRTGQAGYELLDDLSGFSTTSAMFDAAYWRAKEGELARTLLASPRLAAARVHLAVPARRRFAREAERPSASVALTARGGTVTRAEAMAARHLVALAVPGLSADDVAVLDARTGTILAPGERAPEAALDDATTAREARLKSEIEALLAARVGPGRSRVSVNVVLDRTGEVVRERRFDPTSRVVIHDDTEETREESRGGGSDAVTVASNLPDGDAAEGGGETSSRTETRARANYDYDETEAERVRRPGGIARLGVAVLVDGIAETGADGAPAWRPRSAEELASLRGLVEAAVGYDAARGDVIAVESMAFQPAPEIGTGADVGRASWIERHAMTLVQLGVLAAVVLTIALTVLRPLLRRPEAPLVLAPDEALPASAEAARTLGPPEDGEGTAVEAADAPALSEDLFRLLDRETLRAAIAEAPERSVERLRDWLENPDDEAA